MAEQKPFQIENDARFHGNVMADSFSFPTGEALKPGLSAEEAISLFNQLAEDFNSESSDRYVGQIPLGGTLPVDTGKTDEEGNLIPLPAGSTRIYVVFPADQTIQSGTVKGPNEVEYTVARGEFFELDSNGQWVVVAGSNVDISSLATKKDVEDLGNSFRNELDGVNSGLLAIIDGVNSDVNQRLAVVNERLQANEEKDVAQDLETGNVKSDIDELKTQFADLEAMLEEMKSGDIETFTRIIESAEQQVTITWPEGSALIDYKVVNSWPYNVLVDAEGNEKVEIANATGIYLATNRTEGFNQTAVRMTLKKV